MRIVFFGSGAFGTPTFEALLRDHEVVLVVTQPDRPAGRRRRPAPTPIAEAAEAAGIEIIRPESVNDAGVMERIIEAAPDAFVVIAYGQKLGPALLHDRFAVNLHASLLPRYRGAAPSNWAMIEGDSVTGVSVITLAARMDAGDVLGTSETIIEPDETAGALHDRLALLGPDLVCSVLDDYAAGSLTPVPQDDAAACAAPKLTRADGTVRFDQPAEAVRGRVHGLTPWPGCDVTIAGDRCRILQVEALPPHPEIEQAAPGTILSDGTVACATGRVRLVTLQPPGKSPMTLAAYRNGHSIMPGDRVEPMTP